MEEGSRWGIGGGQRQEVTRSVLLYGRGRKASVGWVVGGLLAGHFGLARLPPQRFLFLRSEERRVGKECRL